MSRTMNELVIARDEIEKELAPLYDESRGCQDYKEYLAVSAKIDHKKAILIGILHEMTDAAMHGDGFRYYKIIIHNAGEHQMRGIQLDDAQAWLEANFEDEEIQGANITEVKEDGSRWLFPDFSMYPVDWIRVVA